MLHPVGPLSAAVYWRRRVVVLTLLVAVLCGGGWLGYAAATGSNWRSFTDAAATTTPPPIGTPELEQVVPSLASVRIPTGAATTADAEASTPAARSTTPSAGPVPCTDDVIRLDVRLPGRVAPGAKPIFELRVANPTHTPCVRVVDKGLQELVILDRAGKRLWGSNDCFPEANHDTRTLAPGEIVSFPVIWSGLTSEPGCAGARVPLLPGAYVVRGRLDTKTTADATLVVG